MKKDTITEKKAKQTPAGGVLVGKREGQTIIHDKGTEGGYFVGKLHKEGGIKGINKSTGQPIEVQGGEVIITAPAVADQTKREFEGEMLTNREILSKINEKGGGVSLENGGEILINGSAYNYGGMTMTDYEIMQKMNECGCDDDDYDYDYDDEFEEFKKGGKVVTYKNKYNKKYGYPKDESHSLEEISKDTSVSMKGLQQIYNKGIGAYKTNPSSVRPNVKSKEQWAMARVYSAVMGGKASKVDSNELVMENGGNTNTPNQFWGNVAGGVLIYCTTTKRFLILKRSQYVFEPNTWGIISGKMDDDETSIEEAVIREVKEETDFTIKDLYPSYVFKKGNFTFYNYIGFVDYEFMPKLNWENVEYRWVKLKDFPSNLHFGLKLLIENEDLDNVEKNIDELAFLDDADSFFDDGGKTTSKNKELLNEGTDGVIGGALTVPFSDAVAGFNLSNGTTSTNGSESIINSFEEGGSTKELVEFVEIWSTGSSLSSLYGKKYNNFKEFKDAIAEINPIGSYVYIGANGKSIGKSINVRKDGKNTVVTFNPNTATPKSFLKAIERSYGNWRMDKLDFDQWLGLKKKPKPKAQPKKEEQKTIDLKDKYIQINGDIELAKRVVERAEKLGWDGNGGIKIKLKDNDFIKNIWFGGIENGYVGWDSTIRKVEITELELFGEETQPQPKKEEEKKVEKIDFEATKKYLNQRIATLTKELNFKKPRLSNEEIGFFQRDINTLIQKLRNVNERYLELLPLKNRLENAYSLKWGDINAVYEPSKELLAPNGLPTKLTEEEWINVRNDSFSSFFGDWQLANEIGDFSGVSKVIDPITKEPMPVYHGTNVLFTEWKTYKSNNAHYFAKERDFSTWFAEQWSKGRGDISARDSNLLKQLNPNKGEYVYRCFLDIKNPIDFSRFGVEKRPVSDFLMFLQINYNIGDFDFWTNFRLFNNLAQDTLVYSWMIIRNWQSFTEYVKLATTYDGYIFYEYHPDKVGTGLEGASLSFCTFDSSQIKFTNATEFNSLITDSRFNFGGKL